MNENLKVFLDNVCDFVRCSAVHNDIREELSEHIDELKNIYTEQGYEDEKALNMAISDMGDSEEIGIALDKKHKTQFEWSLIGLIAIIAFIGGAIMFSSSKFEGYAAVNFEKFLIFASMGIAVCIGTCFFDYTKLKKISMPLYAIAAMLLIITKLTGVSAGGTKWLVIETFAISTDLPLFLFLISFAGFVNIYKGTGTTALIKLLGLALPSLVLFITLPNMSRMLILLLCYMVILFTAVIKDYFGGNKKSQLILLGSTGSAPVLFIIANILLKPYLIKRIIGVISRDYLDPQNDGFLQVMVHNWLKNSNLFGKAGKVFGDSIETNLPAVTSDYILVNIIASFGWAAGIFLLFCIAFLIVRMFLTTRKIKNSYGFYLSLSACTALTLQYVISVFMNLNLFPPTAMSLPLVSYGGTGYVVSMAFLGIILSVWRRNNILRIEQKIEINSDSDNELFVVENNKIIINLPRHWNK